jgi:hypothetical protein
MDTPITKNSICVPCYENNIDSKLVPYTKDDHFMICPYCNNIVDKKLMRHVNQNIHPMGYKGGGPVNFEVLSSSKRRRTRVNPYSFTPTEEPVPKFGNFEDKELKSMVANGAIVLSIEDENVDIES